MKETVKSTDDGKFGTKEYVKSFYHSLDSDEKDQFKRIDSQLRDDFGDISRLQRAVMTIAYMVEMRALGEGFKALDSEDDLPKWKRDLLDFARKLYKSEVGKVTTKEKVEERRRSMVDILDDWLSSGDGGDVEEIKPPEFEKIDANALDIDHNQGASPGSGGDDGQPGGDGGIFPGDDPDIDDSEADDDDSGDNSGNSSQKRHSAGSFINVG